MMPLSLLSLLQMMLVLLLVLLLVPTAACTDREYQFFGTNFLDVHVVGPVVRLPL
jgi:hypothetical protein